MSFETTEINTGDKDKFYQLLIRQVEGLLLSENDLIANAANLSSVLYHSLEDVNWVGVYLLKDAELILGPFQGQVACTRIPLGQGVCGTAFNLNKTLRVADVNAFSGHIVCDNASASEVVIPLNIKSKTIGVLDIDSPILNRFDLTDEKYLERIARIFVESIVI